MPVHLDGDDEHLNPTDDELMNKLIDKEANDAVFSIMKHNTVSDGRRIIVKALRKFAKGFTREEIKDALYPKIRS